MCEAVDQTSPQTFLLTLTTCPYLARHFVQGRPTHYPVKVASVITAVQAQRAALHPSVRRSQPALEVGNGAVWFLGPCSAAIEISRQVPPMLPTTIMDLCSQLFS